MTSDLQKLQDMLVAIQAQRDQALNANVVLQAESVALRRMIAERDATIKALGEAAKTGDAPSGVPVRPNGTGGIAKALSFPKQ